LGGWQKVAGKRKENILIVKRTMSMLTILGGLLIKTENFFLLGYDAASVGEWSLTF
jgi:hypothetical protein